MQAPVSVKSSKIELCFKSQTSRAFGDFSLLARCLQTAKYPLEQGIQRVHFL